jgi:hypothetical protein
MLSNSTTDGRDHPVVDLEAATAQATGEPTINYAMAMFMFLFKTL